MNDNSTTESVIKSTDKIEENFNFLPPSINQPNASKQSLTSLQIDRNSHSSKSHISFEDSNEQFLNESSLLAFGSQKVEDLNRSFIEIESECSQKIVNYEKIRNSTNERRKSQIQSEIIASFGSENLNLMKSFTKLEKEKILLLEKRKSNQITNDSNEDNSLIHKCTKKPVVITGSFLSDAKITKSKLVQEKESAELNSKLAPIKNKTNENHSNDTNFGEMLELSVKKKPLIQREKELYQQIVLRNKEEELKLKKNQIKDFVLPSHKIENEQDLEKNKHKSVNTKKVNHSSLITTTTKLEEFENKRCSHCNNEITNKEAFKAFICKHLIHQKCWLGLKFYLRTLCLQCKKPNTNINDNNIVAQKIEEFNLYSANKPTEKEEID